MQEKPAQPAAIQELILKIEDEELALRGREATLKKCRETAAAIEAKRSELGEQLKQVETEEARLQKECAAFKSGKLEDRMAKLNDKIQEFAEKGGKLQQQREEAGEDLNSAEQELARSRAALEEELQEFQHSVGWDSDKMEIAKGITAEEAGQQLELLKLRRAELQRKIQEEGVNIEMLHKDLAKKKADYDAVHQKFNKLSQTLASLRQQVTGRRRRWNAVRQQSVAKMASSFTTYMRRRGHFGTLQFVADDDSGDPLVGDMVVQVATDVHSRRDTNVLQMTQAIDAPSEGNTVKRSDFADLGALSGGEKSITMVALVSALWDAVDVPFAMLDEFDVFMDEATRRSAMVSLLHNAREHKGTRQFLFITPHDISSAVQGSDGFVHVFRLRTVEPLEFD